MKGVIRITIRKYKCPKELLDKAKRATWEVGYQNNSKIVKMKVRYTESF